MDIKALQLESRFSLPPNSLGYCGENTAAAKFKKCIINGKCDGVEDEVSKFIVLHPYLKTISQITGLPKYSHEVIESYWIGNNLLNQAKPEHYNILLDNFLEQGVPDFFVEELRQKTPHVFIPHHLFHVIYIGVGKASGAIPFNLESINNCMIRWGKVIEVLDNLITVNIVSLKTTDNPANSSKIKYQISNIKIDVPYNSDIVPGVKKGDTVAVHWNQVIKKITKDEEKKLSYWTKEVLRFYQ